MKSLESFYLFNVMKYVHLRTGVLGLEAMFYKGTDGMPYLMEYTGAERAVFEDAVKGHDFKSLRELAETHGNRRKVYAINKKVEEARGRNEKNN